MEGFAPSQSRAMLTAFAAIFLSEWADAGQLTAAMLAAQSHAPLTIWFGGTLALAAKGALAVVFGVGLRRHLPRNVLRYGAFACCLLLGVLCLLRAGRLLLDYPNVFSGWAVFKTIPGSLYALAPSPARGLAGAEPRDTGRAGFELR